MADDILINIRTVGVDQVQKASAQIAKLGAVSEQLVGKMSASSRMIMRQVQADKNLAATKAELQRAVKNNIITQGQMNQAMKEAHRQSRILVATDKELIAAEKEKLRIAKEAEAKEAKHAQYVDELRRKYDAQYQQEQALNQTKREYNTLLAAGAISQEEFNHLIAKAEAEARDFEAALAKGGNQFGRFNLEAYRSAQTLKRQVNAQIQQAGYQVGDFFVQIQSGTDIFVAFGQQASQLAGAFNQIGRFSGPMVGAFIAIGTAAATMATQLYQAWTNTQDLDDAIDELVENRQKVEDLFELLQSGPEAIADKFSIATEKIKEMSLELARVDLEKLNRTNIAGVSTFANSPLMGYSYAAVNTKFDQSLNGLSREQRNSFIQEYNAIVSAFESAEGDPLRRYDEFKKLGDLVISYGGKLPEEFLNSQKALNQFAQEHDRLTLSIKRLQAELNGKTYETGFSRALREGTIDLEDMLPGRQVMRTVIDEYTAEANQTLQDRFTQLGLQRGYMSRAAGVAGAGKASRGDVTRFNDALRIRSALESAYFQETLAREEKSQQKINNIYKLYGKTRYESDLAAAEVAEAKRQGLIARNRKVIGGLEQDLADSYIEGVRKRIEEEKKLEAQRKKDEERQKRLDAQATSANKIQMLKNDLLEAELKFGKDSSEYRQEAVYVEGQIAGIKARQKGVSEDLVQDAIALAQEQVRVEQGLSDAADEAKRMKDELREAARAMDALTSVGDSVALALVKANAQVAALSTGGDTTVAGRIAGLREQNRIAMEEAKAAGADLGLVMAAYAETEGDIDKLAVALEKLAAAQGKTKKTDYQKSFEKYKEYVADLKQETAIQSALVGMSEKEQGIVRKLMELKHEYRILGKVFNEEEIERELRKQAAIQKTQEAFEQYQQRQKDLADFMGNSFETAFMSILDGTKSAKEAFRDMAREIIAELYRVLVVQRMVNAAKAFFPFADGGVFSKGSVVPFASGGVVGGPTYFPMSGGRTGLMGEAGPEAIMPLKRGKNGKLGVEASGQGDNITITQSFNFAANGDESVKKIIAQTMPQITEAAKAGVLDARKRGGQFRKVFS